MQFGLKVDVCTYAGMRFGVPALLQLFEALNVRASFFVCCGPDHSGRALRRVFRRGFFEKMRRTSAVSTYGWRTLLYGTLLPGPKVAQRCQQTMREVLSRGHELAMHGYDHVFWQDRMPRLSVDELRAELGRARAAFTAGAGVAPQAFGAPGWQCTLRSMQCEDELALRYHSDTRGYAPYYPQIDGETFKTLEIPTTLPTLDETLGRISHDEADLVQWYDEQLRPGLNVYTAHAEMEGRQQLAWMRAWIETVQRRAPIRRLIDVAAESSGAPAARITASPIAGRSGTVATQEPLP
jgi:peptidoglycan/xylan/chitin deacetylase (PgdA/CDA1 family)